MSCYRCGKRGHPPRATAYIRSLTEPHPDDDLRLMRAYTTMYPITSYLQSPLLPRAMFFLDEVVELRTYRGHGTLSAPVQLSSSAHPKG